MEGTESIQKKSLAVAVGVFFGFSPFWGYQLGLGLVAAYIFKINKPIVALFTHVSIAPLIPFIIYGSFRLGGFILGIETNNFVFQSGLTFDAVKNNLLQYFVGSFAVAAIMAFLFGFGSYLLLDFYNKKRNLTSSDA